MKRVFSIFCVVLLLAVPAQAQQVDRDAYIKAMRTKDIKARVEALTQFLQKYPDSRYATSAYAGLFEDYLSLHQIDKALEAARAGLNAAPKAIRGSLYNRLAWNLAEKKAALDTALAYAERAVQWAEGKPPRTRGMILDTYAYVLYQRGETQKAEEVQLQALAGHEQEGEFHYRLALYQQANGKVEAALTSLARATIFGDLEGNDYFDAWSKDSDLKKRVAEKVAAEFREKSDSRPDEVKARIAGLYSVMGVNLDQAEKLAREVLQQTQSAEYRLLALGSLAMTKLKRGDVAAGLKYLEEGKPLASPYDGEFWIFLGETYEKAGRTKDAVDAYLQGVVAFENPKVRARLAAAYTRLHGSEAGLDDLIAGERAKLESFRPEGRYKSEYPTGRVVLAELFTGAECNPCQSADYAFDGLSEYFSRQQLAIVEYHLHIPGPDPMTNEDTEARAKAYGVRSTPTAIFNGVNMIRGGGPKVATKNRFHVYRYVIEKSLKAKPVVQLDLNGRREGDVVRVRAKITKKSPGVPANVRFHVALVEKKIAYTGANGVNHHIFVVRRLPLGANGKPVDWKGETAEESVAISTSEVEGAVQAYLKHFAENTPPRYRNFRGWNNPPDRIDRGNLAVVAWLQDADSHQVLQAAYVDLSMNDGRKSE